MDKYDDTALREEIARILGYERQEQHSSEEVKWYNLDEYGNAINVTYRIDGIMALIAQRERAARIAEANFWYENEPRQKAKKYSTNLPTDTDYFYVGRIKALEQEENL